MQTGKKINQISNRLRRRSRAIQETIGISGAQGNILNYILVESQNRSVYQKDIEQEFGLRPSTATETLKSLEKNGLIKRETDPNDGRYKKIVFTEKAEQIEAVLKSEIEESETILLQGVTKEERQEFLRIAEKMLQNLDTFPANTVKKNAGRKNCPSSSRSLIRKWEEMESAGYREKLILSVSAFMTSTTSWLRTKIKMQSLKTGAISSITLMPVFIFS